MSGLCGWFSREPGALPIADMAAPLRGPGKAPARCASHAMGAAALVGGHGLYHEDGLLIAHWGERPDTLARLWRTHGAKACAALSGHFAFAILDERRAEALLAVDRCASRPLYYQMVGRTCCSPAARWRWRGIPAPAARSIPRRSTITSTCTRCRGRAR